MQHYKQPTRSKDESDTDKKGRQVNSWFDVSAHNDKIKHIYGNYNLWAWFRYWYVDNVYKQTLMIIDKSYYDYDYDPKQDNSVGVLKSNNFSEEELQDRLAKLGIGTNSNTL